jgi:hypothetical protein
LERGAEGGGNERRQAGRLISRRLVVGPIQPNHMMPRERFLRTASHMDGSRVLTPDGYPSLLALCRRVLDSDSTRLDTAQPPDVAIRLQLTDTDRLQFRFALHHLPHASINT